MTTALLVDRIIKGTIGYQEIQETIQKKFYYGFTGKHAEVSLDKLVSKTLNGKKLIKTKPIENEDRKAVFKFKKEPPKNKTQWDHLLGEMVDF